MNKTEFLKYYQDNFLALSHFAHKLTSNSDDAKDLLQETFIKIFQNKDKYKAMYSFKNWAFTIMKNTFISAYHKKKKNISNKPFEDFEFALESKNPQNVESNLVLNDIKKCIQKLSKKSRKPFTMYVKGYPYDEIAKDLNIPIGTVKSRINFARTKLRPALKAVGIV